MSNNQSRKVKLYLREAGNLVDKIVRNLRVKNLPHSLEPTLLPTLINKILSLLKMRMRVMMLTLNPPPLHHNLLIHHLAQKNQKEITYSS